MLQIVDHPLVQHKLTLMRDQDTKTQQFRQLLREISLLMGYEITRELPVIPLEVQTPLAPHEGQTISGRKLVVVPILRAGLVTAEALLELVPGARVGHIDCYRDHTTKQPVEYLVKLPDTNDRLVIVVDPMLATGNSAVHAVRLLKEQNIEGKNIRFMALVAAPEGMQEFNRNHPDVVVHTAALDSHLDENAYIVPGLGDAGDRLFGTV